MNFNIEFSPEVEARLRRRAAASGTDPASVVRDVIEEVLAGPEPQFAIPQTAEAWSAALHAWAASHKPKDHFVDDSREAIYDRDTK